MARELELKLEIEPAEVDKLREHPLLIGENRVERQISVYFDTPKAKLRRHGWVLRVRQRDDGWVQTIKRSRDSAGLFDRDEWESPVNGPQPELQAIGETPLKDLLGPAQFRHLGPKFRCDIERTTWLINEHGAQVELTHDDGWIESGGAREPVHEVELELKEGEIAALFGIAKQIGRKVPIRLGVSAKSERGFAIAEQKRKQPIKAVDVQISNGADVAKGFTAIVASCLKHFRLNEPLLVRDRDPEALHQLRVAIRRLRTAMWLFKPVVQGPQYERVNDQLRTFTRELGAARNIDVILASMAANDPARDLLEKDRGQLYSRILKKLDTTRFRSFILDIVCWTYSGGWRQASKANRPLIPFARKRLDRLWHRIKQHGKELSHLSEIQRHHLRIDAKKIRYALEFLGDVGDGRQDQREFIAAAEAVQDTLGHLNDLATRRAMLSWPMRPSDEGESRCLRAAKQHLREMSKIGPYWSAD